MVNRAGGDDLLNRARGEDLVNRAGSEGLVNRTGGEDRLNSELKPPTLSSVKGMVVMVMDGDRSRPPSCYLLM